MLGKLESDLVGLGLQSVQVISPAAVHRRVPAYGWAALDNQAILFAAQANPQLSFQLAC